jgi:hypothetical protein
MTPAARNKERESNLVDWLRFNQTAEARAIYARHASELQAAFKAWRESAS